MASDDIQLPPLPNLSASTDWHASLTAYARSAVLADRARRAAPSPQGDAPAYRLLESSDIIQRGDEFLDDDCVNWNGIAGWEAGQSYNPLLFKAGRRQLDAARRTPAKGGE